MKRLFIIALGIVAISCNRNNTPEIVAEKFIIAINQEKFDEAKEYCDKATAEMVGMLGSVGALEGNKNESSDRKIDFKVVKVEKEGNDKAKVFYTVDQEKETSVTLKKIDGQWKVAIDKEQGKEEGLNHHHDHDHHHDFDGEESLYETDQDTEIDTLSVE